MQSDVAYTLQFTFRIFFAFCCRFVFVARSHNALLFLFFKDLVCYLPLFMEEVSVDVAHYIYMCFLTLLIIIFIFCLSYLIRKVNRLDK